MTHFRPTEDRPTEYGQSRDEREDAVACMREHRAWWWVAVREGNRSAFNGYHWTPSAYSECRCAVCHRRWRTTARYVRDLPDSPPPTPWDHPAAPPLPLPEPEPGQEQR